MFIKIMLIKKDIDNIFNILNKIIMHIFLLFIDIDLVMQNYKNILGLIMVTRLDYGVLIQESLKM